MLPTENQYSEDGQLAAPHVWVVDRPSLRISAAIIYVKVSTGAHTFAHFRLPLCWFAYSFVYDDGFYTSRLDTNLCEYHARRYGTYGLVVIKMTRRWKYASTEEKQRASAVCCNSQLTQIVTARSDWFLFLNIYVRECLRKREHCTVCDWNGIPGWTII